MAMVIAMAEILIGRIFLVYVMMLFHVVDRCGTDNIDVVRAISFSTHGCGSASGYNEDNR